MTVSNVLGTYRDVLAAFRQALTAPVTLTFPTKAEAVRWRIRAYHFRKLLSLRDLNGETPFDSLVIRWKKDSLSLRIEPATIPFTMQDDEGNTIPIPSGNAAPSLSLSPSEAPDLSPEDLALLEEVKGLLP